MWFVDKLGHLGKAKLHGSPHLPMLHMLRTKRPQNEEAPPTIMMCTDRAETNTLRVWQIFIIISIIELKDNRHNQIKQ